LVSERSRRDNQQPTTNNQQPTTNNQSRRNNQQPTTIDITEYIQLVFTDYTLRTITLGTAILGAICGMLGSFAVLRKQSLLGDAISHAALPGIAKNTFKIRYSIRINLINFLWFWNVVINLYSKTT